MNGFDQSGNTLCEWVALSLVSGIGRRTAATVVDKLGSAGACFQAPPSQLEALGLKPDVIDSLRHGGHIDRAKQELDGLDRLKATILTINDPDYPELLKQTYDPPIVLYCLGQIGRALTQPAVAMVGSRRCSTYGRNAAEMLSREIASRGVCVISGLARGIDSSAHRGALEGRGTTVAVLGTGLDVVYPKENAKLAQRIAAEGALITEFPLGTPPLSQNFPFRNRVISGLALGVVVVEGAERSGSLITARMAYEQGRDVFAVPGNITSSKSFGPNYLIKDGAKLVQTWQDIVEEFPSKYKASILSQGGERQGTQPVMDELVLSDPERRVLGLLKTDEPVHIDQLIYTSKLATSELMAALLSLEMAGRVRQLPGKNFLRRL